MILVSSYTANLAAFLTIESLVTPIDNVDDLAANKGGVMYGAKTGGSTFTFFKVCCHLLIANSLLSFIHFAHIAVVAILTHALQDAQYPTYQKMYEFMRDHPEYMPSTNAEGVERVENENFAFLMESTSIEYITERRCTLGQVGSLLDEKGYGIAMRKRKQLRNCLPSIY